MIRQDSKLLMVGYYDSCCSIKQGLKKKEFKIYFSPEEKKGKDQGVASKDML